MRSAPNAGPARPVSLLTLIGELTGVVENFPSPSPLKKEATSPDGMLNS